jgi:hypothetical protein
LYERSARSWVVDPRAEVGIDLPLHPPSEREVLHDLDAARAWVQAWRDAEAAKPLMLQWEERSWARVGRQSVPARVRIDGAEALATVAGKRREWVAWRTRIEELRAAVMSDARPVNAACSERRSALAIDALPVDVSPIGAARSEQVGADRSEQVDAALRTHARAIGLMEYPDAEILRRATAWLVRNPVSGLRVRQVPVRGMHTKWLERHRAMVEGIVGAATGSDGLGLVDPEDRLRVMILDPRLRRGGLRDVAAPIRELAALPFDDRLRLVLIVENLETLLALPDVAGIVAIHGSGYIGHRVGALPWVQSRPVLYWGDLDSHGFAIPNRVRAAGIEAQSVLMDPETLLAHRDLWVREPTPFRGELPRLTASEQAARDMLRAEGDVRLEQERIGWDLAWARVAEAIAAVGLG